MSNTPDMSIYESTFAPSDKTDAILVVDGKKLHVNKALLSSHSDYFKTLFNSDFAGKSMSEIPIKDVKFEEFATLLSCIQDRPIPIPPTVSNVEKLLQLSDRFLIPEAKLHVEFFIGYSTINRGEKLELADKYNLEGLLTTTVESFNKKEDFHNIYYWVKKFSEHTRATLFEKLLRLLDCGVFVLDDPRQLFRQ